MATISFLTLQILNTWIESNNGLHNGLALSKGGKSQATGLSRYSRGNFISAGVDGIVNLFEEFFLLEGCGVGLYSLSFYNLSVGSPYARPKKKQCVPQTRPKWILTSTNRVCWFEWVADSLCGWLWGCCEPGFATLALHYDTSKGTQVRESLSSPNGKFRGFGNFARAESSPQKSGLVSVGPTRIIYFFTYQSVEFLCYIIIYV